MKGEKRVYKDRKITIYYTDLALDEYKSCIGKNKHSSKENAKKALDSLLESWKYKQNGKYEKIHIYECPFCFKWHIGHEPSLINCVENIEDRLFSLTLWQLIKLKYKHYWNSKNV